MFWVDYYALSLWMSGHQMAVLHCTSKQSKVQIWQGKTLLNARDYWCHLFRNISRAQPRMLCSLITNPFLRTDCIEIPSHSSAVLCSSFPFYCLGVWNLSHTAICWWIARLLGYWIAIKWAYFMVFSLVSVSPSCRGTLWWTWPNGSQLGGSI